jgi:hypothetical protein
MLDEMTAEIAAHYRWNEIDPRTLSPDELHRALVLAMIAGIRCGANAVRRGHDPDKLINVTNAVMNDYATACRRVSQ